MSNFGGKLFQESHPLEDLAASYLRSYGIDFDPTVLDIYGSGKAGAEFPEGVFERGPLRTFIRLEAADWVKHNVETLFEHATHQAPTGNSSAEAWARLMERIDKTAAWVKDVPEAELDALIDEAAHYVRHLQRHETDARCQYSRARQHARSGAGARTLGHDPVSRESQPGSLAAYSICG
jgi:hypothetical protein